MNSISSVSAPQRAFSLRAKPDASAATRENAFNNPQLPNLEGLLTSIKNLLGQISNRSSMQQGGKSLSTDSPLMTAGVSGPPLPDSVRKYMESDSFRAQVEADLARPHPELNNSGDEFFNVIFPPHLKSTPSSTPSSGLSGGSGAPGFVGPM